MGPLELLVAKLKKYRKLLVELRTEFVVVSGVIVSMKAFATFQISAISKTFYPLNWDSQI